MRSTTGSRLAGTKDGLGGCQSTVALGPGWGSGPFFHMPGCSGVDRVLPCSSHFQDIKTSLVCFVHRYAPHSCGMCALSVALDSTIHKATDAIMLCKMGGSQRALRHFTYTTRATQQVVYTTYDMHRRQLGDGIRWAAQAFLTITLRMQGEKTGHLQQLIHGPAHFRVHVLHIHQLMLQAHRHVQMGACLTEKVIDVHCRCDRRQLPLQHRHDLVAVCWSCASLAYQY